ncbi:hypothetical protein NQ176_g947 [Zarea fungicola]|uniref:Uncharacterized protein n=1 Tax=Zarea fungicola TaxID=93591 RepID=A0ACC1NUR9_9HYPO|nr:hypothetical protein NQ176_g947 [Lecanicillium fungicola]
MYSEPNKTPLSSFKALSFDVYATLIDWESGIYTALEPINARLPSGHSLKDSRQGLLELFSYYEGYLQNKHPGIKYAALLGMVYEEMSMHLCIPLSSDTAEEEKATFGGSVSRWPAFPDTVNALRTLAKSFKLLVLSNVDAESFAGTLHGPLENAHFDAVYTAEDIGSYKPNLRNFEYMIQHAEKDLGIKKHELLHTAQALWHDHIPAQKLGLKTCWIKRRGADAAFGGREEDFSDLHVSFRFLTLADLAKAVEDEFD